MFSYKVVLCIFIGLFVIKLLYFLAEFLKIGLDALFEVYLFVIVNQT